MSIRIASLLLSLLAHGTVLLYLGSFTPHDRPAAAGSGLRVALARKENGRRQAMPSAAPVIPAVVPKPEPDPVIPQPTPEPVVSAAEPEQPRTAQPLLATQAPSAAARPATRPPEAVSKARKAPVPRTQPPATEPVMPQPHPAVEPLAPRLASTASVEGREPHETSESSSPSGEALREIERSYMDALVAAIERHKRYPLRARKRGYEGEVQVRFTVLRDGTISRVAIGSSSFRTILDRAASRAVLELGRFEPIPSQLGRDHWEFQVPIRFVMNE
jgi:protein TonB